MIAPRTPRSMPTQEDLQRMVNRRLAEEQEIAADITKCIQENWGDFPSLTILQVLRIGDVLAPYYKKR